MINISVPMIQYVYAGDFTDEVENYCIEHEISIHYQSDVVYIEDNGNVFAKWLYKNNYIPENGYFHIAIGAT